MIGMSGGWAEDGGGVCMYKRFMYLKKRTPSLVRRGFFFGKSLLFF